ncbi:MAG: ABC transporter substrate-binding protein, partial [Spirochaetia bacterium]
MRLRNILLVAVAVLSVITLSCKKEEKKAEGPIKIAVAGAHSGDLASYGLPTVNAAQLVAADVNENGGILGRQVELVVEDD